MPEQITAFLHQSVETVTHMRGWLLVVFIIFLGFVIHVVTSRLIGLVGPRIHFPFVDAAKRVMKMLVVAICAVFIMGALGVDLGGIWTMISAAMAMVAVGFVAMWSVLSNALCTMIILFTHPFEIGDEIEFMEPAIKGRVVNLNFMYTTLENDDGSLVQVPNNMFFQRIIKRRPGKASVTLGAQLQNPERME
ncbi:MAG: mechanosensitive ion channel family protein [Opitutaceae bacterium]|jgi:small-conductance mechanosensitive channel|nr:mechanosensitive ion channel family protein [Opitutaceae bacterium]